MNFMKQTTLLFFVFLLSACSTTSNYSIPNVPRPAGNFTNVIDKWSRTEKVYSGVMTSFQVSATMHTTDVIEHHVYQEAVSTQRTTPQYQEMRSRALIDNQNQTQFMITFFTDKEADNDLDKKKTLWNLFLDVEGRRISPKQIKRVIENRAALKEKYPYLSHWGKQYLVSFPVKVEEVQTRKSTLTLAGPLGAVYLQFPNE